MFDNIPIDVYPSKKYNSIFVIITCELCIQFQKFYKYRDIHTSVIKTLFSANEKKNYKRYVVIFTFG